jgi:NodT family efflux transporter outer membrane factor (OMF) lipoprotein
MRAHFALAGGALALSACAVGPNFHTPAAPNVSAYTPAPLPAATPSAPVPGGASQKIVAGMDVAGDWQTLFQSPALTALVAQAVKANPDLAAAKAALRAAHETYLAQRGALFPSAGVDYNVSRQKATDTLAPPLSDNNNLFTLHTLTLTVAYTPDVFGGIRRQVESAAAQAEDQKWQTEAAYLTLTSNVVSGAIQEASLYAQLTATERLISLARDSLAVVRRQKEEGQAAGLDVAAQESALAQAQASLPPLKKQLALQRDQLAQLTGRFPSDVQEAPLDLNALTLPAELPESLPSKLVAQRPDILAASANLHAASAQVGVAIAARLPAFTVTGQAGGASTLFSTLLSGSNSFYSIAGDVAQPIFQGGALYHRQKAAEATLDQAKEQYRGTVLSAFQNVADALEALDADSAALGAAARAETAAKTTLDITRRQQDTGQVAGLAVMLAEQTYQQALITRIQAQAARYTDTVVLYVALGGGWWNRKDL